MECYAIFDIVFVLCRRSGGVWQCFKKKFSESLAPAFFIHIFIMLFSAMLFHRISLGIAIGIILACGIIVYKIVIAFREKRGLPFDVVNDTGLLIFVLFYIFIIFSNIDKCFMDWDEFSHWGVFLKEMLRIDDLYCISSKDIVHKDYVPAITLFEVLWCKLSGRYVEADAYRAMQMLQFAMILPIVNVSDEGERNTIVDRMSLSINCYKIVTDIIKAILALSIPIVFSGQSFYHTIYQDMILGLLVFYCVYLVWCKMDNESYRCFILTLALMMLVLTKMVAMAFLPMIVVYYIVDSSLYHKRKVKKKFWILTTALPFAVWGLLNK